MTESRSPYRVTSAYTSDSPRAIMDTELDTLLEHLPDIERLLLSLLVKVQRAQGKEPTVITRAERRRA